MRRRPVQRGAGLERGLPHPLEIDMDGEIRLARFRQRSDELMPLHRLQRIAEAGTRRAVIDEQRRPACRSEMAGKLRDDIERDRRLLEHSADRCGDLQRAPSRSRHAEGEVAVIVEPDQPLAPAFGRHHELVERQGVEELVGDRDDRAVERAGHRIVPDRFEPFQRRRLPATQDGAGLDEMNGQRRMEARHDPRRPQHIGHQRAAPRPELDEAEPCRRAHRLPGMGRPEPDQLTEHLADFGRRGEVAPGPERIARHVIAVAGMAERQRHVAADADRPFQPDQLDDLGLERGHARASPGASCLLRSTSHRPAKNTGSESSMPMVIPPESASTEVPNRKPSCGSGSRKNSQTIRATA